jgi:hypothetical protein
MERPRKWMAVKHDTYTSPMVLKYESWSRKALG